MITRPAIHRVLMPPTDESVRTRRDTSPPVLVQEHALETHFQPIISLRNGTVFAVEALTRAFDEQRNRQVPPATLFGVAEELEILGEFDRFCRRRAVERFATLGNDAPFALSLNWDSRTLGSFGADPGQLSRLVDRLGLPRSRIIIEVLESRVDDLSALVRFVRERRSEGFIVAIDDYGTGHSTPERLARIEPDVIKIDRALVHGLVHSAPQREACRAVVELARSLGALVVAEGVEEDDDIVAAAMIGIDLFQGFAFARPVADLHGANAQALDGVRRVLPSVRAASTRRADSRRATRTRHEAVVAAIAASIEETSSTELDARLAQLVFAHPEVEAVYALSSSGIQRTATATRSAPSRSLFHAAPRGADQSLKDYFLELATDSPRYSSTPYLSMATGHTCVTHSRRVVTRDGELIVLCCDLPVDAHAI